MGRDIPGISADQKRPFLIRVGPFLDLLPFKGPFPLTGPFTVRPLRERALRGLLTGRPLAGPLREAPYGEGRSLREGPVLTGIQNWAGISACVP